VDAEGLAAALTDLAARVASSHGIDCAFDQTGPVRVEDNLTATQLYRISQEAVTNALKHSHARSISIALADDDGSVALRIRDDGIGIRDPEPEGNGLGLRIMRYRAGLINAQIQVESQAGTGTVVTCTLPRRFADGSSRPEGR
jgi:signal transduction histidine kinase